MNILYLASVFDDECIKKYCNNQYVLSYAASKYHTLLIDGLCSNRAQVDVLSVLPINRKNSRKKVIVGFKRTKKNLRVNYLGFINLAILKRITLFFRTFFQTLFYKRNSVVLYDVLCTSSSAGAILAAKLRRFKLVAIVTDLPDFSLTEEKAKNVRIKNLPIEYADAYVLLTKQMNDKINPFKKPSIILEGHVDAEMARRQPTKAMEGKKTVIYAGSIMKKYGIAFLCNAFVKYSHPDEELHIYGLGDFEEELTKNYSQYKNIIYHGNRPNDEIIEAEMNATLLVNPRPTQDEYTKYSFPSKTLEYLASGTPVLSSRLPGIPDEYNDYLFYFDDDTVDSLGKRIREILDSSSDLLLEKGKLGRDFVLREKNNIRQAAKIIDFIEHN